jgi:type II secretory pathway pseudopilin PulG
MRFKQQGLTLLELILVIALTAISTLMASYDRQADFEQAQARLVGGTLFQYNNAVRASLGQDNNIAVGTRTGSAWLKNTTCGGTYPIGKELLPCNFPSANAANPIAFGKLGFTTIITATGVAPNRKITATTTTSPFTLYRSTTPQLRSDLAGMAAISAAASLGTGYTTGIAGASPFSAATDSSFKSDASTAQITMLASNTSAGDIWLRTDGGNSMHAPLTFDGVDPLNRQITGASRIQNIAGQVLYLGNPTGIAPISGASVVMDANTEVIGSLRVRNSLVVDNGAAITGSVSVTGNVSANQNISASGAIYAGQSVTAAGAVTAGGNVSAGGVLMAQLFYDSNNTGYYVDPASASNLNYLQTANINNLGSIVSAGRIKTSEYLEVGGIADEGDWCAQSGLVGRTAPGKLLSCQSNVWRASGIDGTYTYVGTFTGSMSVNTGSKAQIIQVSGGNAAVCGGDGTNRYSLAGIAAGYQVAYAADNNPDWAKTGFISFGVPANSNYTIISNPYACGPGVFQVFAFTL